MNRYKKRKPNIWLLEADDLYNKGDIVTITTRYGKDNEHIIHNLIFSKEDKNYYSITRADGYNSQERARKKAEKYNTRAGKQESKARTYYKESNRDRDFLTLAEPIKVGHHSEKRHRKAIDRAWDKMGKSVEVSYKAQEHQSKAEYREAQAEKINLSMPESIEYYEHLAQETETIYKKMKATPKNERPHSYSLTYANKDFKKAKENLEIAKRLWG